MLKKVQQANEQMDDPLTKNQDNIPPFYLT